MRQPKLEVQWKKQSDNLNNHDFFTLSAMEYYFVMCYGANVFEECPEYNGFIMNPHIPALTMDERLTDMIHSLIDSYHKQKIENVIFGEIE